MLYSQREDKRTKGGGEQDEIEDGDERVEDDDERVEDNKDATRGEVDSAIK